MANRVVSDFDRSRGGFVDQQYSNSSPIFLEQGNAYRGGVPESQYMLDNRGHEDLLGSQLQLQQKEIMELRNAMQRCEAALQHEKNEHQHTRRLLGDAEQHARQQVGEVSDRVKMLQEDIRRKDLEIENLLQDLQPLERKIMPIEQREKRAWAQLKQMESEFLRLEESMRGEVQRTKQYEQLLRQHQNQYRDLEMQYQDLEVRYEKEYQVKQQVTEVVKEVEVDMPVAVSVQKEVVVQRSQQRVVQQQQQQQQQQVMITYQQQPVSRYVSTNAGYAVNTNAGYAVTPTYATGAYATGAYGTGAYTTGPAVVPAPAYASYGSQSISPQFATTTSGLVSSGYSQPIAYSPPTASGFGSPGQRV